MSLLLRDNVDLPHARVGCPRASTILLSQYVDQHLEREPTSARLDGGDIRERIVSQLIKDIGRLIDDVSSDSGSGYSVVGGQLEEIRDS